MPFIEGFATCQRKRSLGPSCLVATLILVSSTYAAPVRRANPASENCVRKGGKSVTQQGPNGQFSVCVFDDNRQCEE
jgi:putative hemolysin